MIYIDWNEYIYDINKLIDYNLVELSKYKFLYGIPRGGVILATIMSYRLNIPIIDDHIVFLKKYYKTTLIIDDIFDTGKSLDIFINDHDTLTLYANLKEENKNKKLPTYFLKDSKNEWIVFPYEYDNNTQIQYKDNISKEVFNANTAK